MKDLKDSYWEKIASVSHEKKKRFKKIIIFKDGAWNKCTAYRGKGWIEYEIMKFLWDIFLKSVSNEHQGDEYLSLS